MRERRRSLLAWILLVSIFVAIPTVTNEVITEITPGDFQEPPPPETPTPLPTPLPTEAEETPTPPTTEDGLPSPVQSPAEPSPTFQPFAFLLQADHLAILESSIKIVSYFITILGVGVTLVISTGGQSFDIPLISPEPENLAPEQKRWYYLVWFSAAIWIITFFVLLLSKYTGRYKMISLLFLCVIYVSWFVISPISISKDIRTTVSRDLSWGNLAFWTFVGLLPLAGPIIYIWVRAMRIS